MHRLQVSPSVIKAVNFFSTEVPAPVSLKNKCSSLKMLEATIRRHLHARKMRSGEVGPINIFRVENSWLGTYQVSPAKRSFAAKMSAISSLYRKNSGFQPFKVVSSVVWSPATLYVRRSLFLSLTEVLGSTAEAKEEWKRWAQFSFARRKTRS